MRMVVTLMRTRFPDSLHGGGQDESGTAEVFQRARCYH